jgi:predicted transcriptional regulator
MPPMKVLIDIEDEDGEVLDALAKEQDRSRSAQARHMLTKALREVNQEQPQASEVVEA